MNIHTEDEAKTKWCPLSRVTAMFGDAAVNRNSNHYGMSLTSSGTNCIGSKCMFWQWVPHPVKWKDSSKTTAIITLPSPPPTHGYCGAVKTSEPTDYTEI